MNLIKNYSIKNIKTQINKYGYSYSTKDFLIEVVLILTTIFTIACLSRLQLSYILVLILITLILIPFMIKAWFYQSYSIERFEMLSDYLSNVIPIFTQKTKIRFTLGELFSLTSGAMRDAVKRAIDYLDNTNNDPDIFENSLKIIEKEFPNSRVKSVHKIMLSIESSNSVSFSSVCENMYKDIENWLKRVFTFQKELKNRRIKLLILCGTTLLMNCVFVYIYVSNEYFNGFTHSPIYQISTLVFIASILITMTIVLTKLNGEWLIEDLNYSRDEKLKEEYLAFKEGKKKLNVIDVTLFILCIVSTAYVYLNFNIQYAFLPFMLGIVVLFKKSFKYKKIYKELTKALTIEFPIWLREISLTLNSLTVLNAIENSQNMASYPLRTEIKDFLQKAKKDPTSIKPYGEFLSDFDLEDARSSMKVLYAISNVGKDEIKDRVSNLIDRNQQMLDKAERLKNEDSIGAIEAIGYLPIALFSIEMLVSMFAMFAYMMSAIGSNVNI